MKPVTLYSTRVCGYCMRAKALLDSKHIPYTEFLVDAEPARRDEMLKKSGGKHTVPQIFIGDQHVGGYTELYQLDSRGGLEAMLAD
ncbi:MAG TPA: glutaredoxin 3 [Gammaproteobacteria bacterium]|jgi:glutaredoxin 3|nr:glutaredoxin 3 [Gammaproteobacteria bacterium]